jgi:acetyl-CoA acyltransferase
MREALIVEAVRTPVGRRGGALADVHPVDLSAIVLTELIERTGIAPGEIDDVVWGCVAQVGDQAFNIARSAVLAAGWPYSVTGTTMDRQCGSSQQAVHAAAAALVSGQCDVCVAGGVESMSRVPIGSSAASAADDSHNQPFGDTVLRRLGGAPHQGDGAEIVARRWGLTRVECDEFSLSSHARAAAATDDGRFAAEIVPVARPDGTVVAVDEGIRRGSTAEQLARLPTMFRPDGVVTAAGSSQISDGAAAVLMATPDAARRLGLRAVARVHTAVVAGDDPVAMLTAPIPATRKALARSGLDISDIGAFEVNEAFAPVPLAWQRELGVDSKLLNPNGGAIAIGHPLGGSGARILATLVHHLCANGIRFGLQTMCEAGGQANATIVERL